MKDYQKMTQKELEKELAEIVKKNYEKGVTLLDRNYDICSLKKLTRIDDVEDIDAIIAIIRSMKYKPDLKQYCEGMTDGEPLIHPILNEYAWKEKVYEDFISREEFINRTGIFVTPQYFSYIYDMEWKEAKESGKSLDQFIDNYEHGELNGGVEAIPLHGTFKYIVSDDYLSCIGEFKDEVYDPNIWEIINCLARNHEEEYESKWNTIEEYKAVLNDITQTLQRLQMLFTEPSGTMLN